eukprot:CAMPEP_0204289034 /NCGR_PEP_ID=MMETSP0468-20130131/57946_1 /ASSEMBLY_ACC=CAM_ASM_000383 /TAXON_ID=2969 /ORGANISM="Oxyrrhis marina" /LENGTH=44 /DNA_ID= /DNA_START= /DNA_END= /DNA_ORIENTATION=
MHSVDILRGGDNGGAVGDFLGMLQKLLSQLHHLPSEGWCLCKEA